MIWRTKFPTIKAEHEDGGNHGHFRELLQHPRFLWAVLAQFMYVGAQVGTWSFMSLMFPTIFALGLKGLGPNTKIGGSLLVMAIIGGAGLYPGYGFHFRSTA